MGLELAILALIPGLGNVAWRLAYADSHMKNLLITLVHFVVVTAKLCGPVACEQ